ncbi:MAG: acyl-CoA thioesterase [Solirubrobacteraceae bacterium]|jgi:acyl-CoA thioester hydrolase|nr:acyl-CoA thioesterase [Solirubrobacteraceae bacterium]MDP4672096.1 acyl-CoA thioesterase [Solirubrobacteraceae bacterium]
MAPFRYTLRVRFNECDPQNVAFNANYLTYIDIAITELYRQRFDASYAEVMASSGVDVVVAEAKLKFLAPARFDDQIEIAITVERLGNTAMEVSALISRDREELVFGELRYVFVDLESWKKTPIPDQIRATMAQLGPG